MAAGHSGAEGGDARAAASDGEAATLALTELNGVPALRATGGSAVPAELVVVDGDGNRIAVYTAGPAVATKKNMATIMSSGVWYLENNV
ncbi:hypothetical protein ACIA6E_20330 [Streptomyces sp. NPDC051815]|uniref:hypothetical protein n=1 Tax=Streptomyces sp. NPDC051815 TaxID=3365674 RepID=UPI00378BFFBC